MIHLPFQHAEFLRHERVCLRALHTVCLREKILAYLWSMSHTEMASPPGPKKWPPHLVPRSAWEWCLHVITLLCFIGGHTNKVINKYSFLWYLFLPLTSNGISLPTALGLDAAQILKAGVSPSLTVTHEDIAKQFEGNKANVPTVYCC